MNFLNSPVFNRVIVPISFMTSLGGGFVLYKEHNGGKKCPSNDQMHGKVVVITGASSGIGKETARDLACRGATVVMGCRHMGKGEAIAKEIRQLRGTSDVICKFIDLANLDSVAEFAEDVCKDLPHVDVLINNAGVMKPRPPKTTPETDDGFERQFGVNHLGHFLLTNLLTDALTNGDAPGRVINLTAEAFKRGKIDLQNINKTDLKGDERLNELYYQSKLANVLFTHALSERGRKRITCNCVHPGVAHTNINRYSNIPTYAFLMYIISPIKWLMMKTPMQAAQTSIYLACDAKQELETGGFYDDCEKVANIREICDVEQAEELWMASEKWTDLPKRLEEMRENLAEAKRVAKSHSAKQ